MTDKLVYGPEGQRMWFPEDMSDEEIERVMQGEFPPQNSTHDVDQDIAHSVLQFGRDLGESAVGLPGDIDQLERTAVRWLQSQQGIAKQIGDAWGSFDEMTGTDINADTSLPTSESVQQNVTAATGMEPYTPQTNYGKAAYAGMEGATAALGFGLRNVPKVAKGVGKVIKHAAVPTAATTYTANELRKMLYDQQSTSSDHYR